MSVIQKVRTQMTIEEITAYEQGYSDGFKKAMTHYLDVTQGIIDATDRINRLILDHNKLIMVTMEGWAMNNPESCGWSFYLAYIPICQLETIPCDKVSRCPARVAGLLDPVEANFEIVEDTTLEETDNDN